MNTCEKLLSSGWREGKDQFKSYARMFYKRFDTPTKCNCNDRMQVILYVSELHGTENIEMQLCGELKDKTWIKLEYYSLPRSIDEVTKLIPRILKTWEYIANN